MYDAFVDRQPIFDQNMSVYAYELLFRDGDQSSAGRIDGNQASSQVMLNTFAEFGLDSIVGNHLAFINLTHELLVDDMVQMLPRNRVVLEVLETVTVDDALIAAVKNLSSQGYLIALDDFIYDEEWRPLVEIADIIKLDVLALKLSEIEEYVRFLRPFKTRLLAEKVETMEQFIFLKNLGFDYYQGYFLSRPSVVQGKRTPTNKISILQLLSKLMRPDPDHSEIETLISQDVTLSYKVLRFINAARFALPRKVESINEATVYLGLNNIRRFASMIALAGFNDQPHEILLTALLRARMCELLAKEAGIRDIESFFSLGLFSALDILLGMPMSEVVNELPLGDELERALLYKSGELGEALGCVLAYERQQWDAVNFAALPREEISGVYLEAVKWSNETGISMQV
jgi:EAL and modified HD-GYP domain-containing signal transduction protein